MKQDPLVLNSFRPWGAIRSWAKTKHHTHLDWPHYPIDIITLGRISTSLFPISNLNESYPHPLEAHTHTNHGLERRIHSVSTQWKIPEPQKQRHLVEPWRMTHIYIRSFVWTFHKHMTIQIPAEAHFARMYFFNFFLSFFVYYWPISWYGNQLSSRQKQYFSNAQSKTLFMLFTLIQINLLD